MSELDPGKQEIMDATFRALSKHGYGDLTIQRIADEFDKSKSLLYYHYDSKEELLADAVNYTTQQFIDELQLADASPTAQLRHLVDRLLPETIDSEQRKTQVALLELRSQVPHVEVYAEQYTEVDTLLKETLTDIIENGIAQDEFVDVDAAREAELLVSILSGMRTRRLTSADFSAEDARDALHAHLTARLFKQPSSGE